MNDFESVVEENENYYEEHEQEMPEYGELFPFEEQITITKINS